MCIITESNVLLRAQSDLPAGFKMATDEFREGWKRIRAGGKRRLEKKVQTKGWNFIRIADGTLRSGVGETSQEAIASALKLALRRVGAHSNAVEVERIELTQYPWFFLARVSVNPYRIQPGEALPVSDEEAMPTLGRKRRLPLQARALLPQFGGAMPMLKEMLRTPRSVTPQGAEAGAQ
jgi:hypothetical protein